MRFTHSQRRDTCLASWQRTGIFVSGWFRNGIYRVHNLLTELSANIDHEAWCLNGRWTLKNIYIF